MAFHASSKIADLDFTIVMAEINKFFTTIKVKFMRNITNKAHFMISTNAVSWVCERRMEAPFSHFLNRVNRK